MVLQHLSISHEFCNIRAVLHSERDPIAQRLPYSLKQDGLPFIYVYVTLQVRWL